MTLNKKEIIYASVGLFVFLVIYASTRKIDLVEVYEPQQKNFDNSKLPKELQPPQKLVDGEPIPEGAKRNFSKYSNLPRFDKW